MLQRSQLLQGRYQLQENLGRNAGRQTWLAVDVEASPSEKVIVKLLAFSPQMQWEDFKLFEREAQVLKNLHHPRIPRYRDYFSLDKQAGSGLCWFALVQDYIPGKSLQQLLDEGRRFTEVQVRSLAIQVLEILTHLHELNPAVLHRDIKPSNLILGENEQIYLVDFGAVQEQAAVEGVTFTVVGTAGYAPLEQFWGKAVPASDLYSLGATLIHILTGVAPVDLPQKNLRVQFSDRVGVNPNFVRWIEAMTTPDLAQRYHSAQQALEDLKSDRYLNASLLQIPQPYGSRIKLWKSPDRLKIEIPGRGIKVIGDLVLFIFKILIVGVSLFGQTLNLLLIGILSLVILLLLSSLNMVGFFLSSAIFGLTCLLFRLFISSNKEFSKVLDERKQFSLNIEDNCLQCDRTFIILEKKLFNWVYFRYSMPMSKIKDIEKILASKSVKPRKFTDFLFISRLTKSERRWLQQEIRNWSR